MILHHPITSEKAVRLIEAENKIMFVVDKRALKQQVKKAMEKDFKVKVEKINLHIKDNKKIAIIKLKAETPAIDVATKLGII